MSTIRIRRDEVRPGDIVRSSLGYRLLITDVWDSRADVRPDDRYVAFTGHLHADPSLALRTERYPAAGVVEVERNV